MTKFLVLYRASGSVAEQMAGATPEQMKAGMDAWMTWAAKAGDGLIDLGAPLAPAAELPSTSSTGAGDQVCGFSLLQSDSAGSLKAVLAKHPHLQMGGSIEVLEFLPMPGM